MRLHLAVAVSFSSLYDALTLFYSLCLRTFVLAGMLTCCGSRAHASDNSTKSRRCKICTFDFKSDRSPWTMQCTWPASSTKCGPTAHCIVTAAPVFMVAFTALANPHLIAAACCGLRLIASTACHPRACDRPHQSWSYQAHISCASGVRS